MASDMDDMLKVFLQDDISEIPTMCFEDGKWRHAVEIKNNLKGNRKDEWSIRLGNTR